MNLPTRKIFRSLVSALAVLLLWHVAGAYLLPSFLPVPLAVVERLLELLQSTGPYGNTAVHHLQKSLVRVLIVAVIGLVLSMGLGLSMGLDSRVEASLSPWLPFWMTIPTVVVVLVTMIMFNFSQLSVITGVAFAATPYATVNIWEGAKNIDSELVEMGRAFDASGTQMWRNVFVPSVLPYLFGSFRYLLSMVWKVVVLAETFGLNEGLGSMLRFYYGQGDLESMLAYLLLFLCVMLVFQYGLAPLESRLFEWRS